MRLLSYFVLLQVLSVTSAVRAASPLPEISVTPAPDGTDLITFYRDGIPQLAILQDRSRPGSEPATPRFRQVWMLTDVNPGWKQRMASAIPFFYHRAGRNIGSNKPPSPIMDLSQPSKGTVSRIAESVAQVSVFDSYGILLRAPTRAYLGNALDSRNMELARALDIVEQAKFGDSGLDAGDFDEVRGRLLLAQRLLGGFVEGERVTKAASQERTRDLEDRAANWDLLRQAAEANGLYVQPLETSEAVPQHAVLWFADREPPASTRFNAGFLAIADPFHDARVKQWNGYTASWTLDSDGAVVNMGPTTDSDSAARATRMIPLAVYALDYPRVPLLLIDFHSERARRREVVRRTAGDVTTSIFGITPYSSLGWFAARTSYLWVRDRHGAAFNRSQRLASYARLRQTLLDDQTEWDPRFHQLLESKLDAIALNPFEQGSASEAVLAQRQYESLLRWINDPQGLTRTLDRERAAEKYRETHTAGERAWAKTLTIATLGAWKPYSPASTDASVQPNFQNPVPLQPVTLHSATYGAGAGAGQ